MPQEFKPGCARPTGGVVGEKEKEIIAQSDQPEFKKLGAAIIFLIKMQKRR